MNQQLLIRKDYRIKPSWQFLDRSSVALCSQCCRLQCLNFSVPQTTTTLSLTNPAVSPPSSAAQQRRGSAGLSLYSGRKSVGAVIKTHQGWLKLPFLPDTVLNGSAMVPALYKWQDIEFNEGADGLDRKHHQESWRSLAALNNCSFNMDSKYVKTTLPQLNHVFVANYRATVAKSVQWFQLWISLTNWCTNLSGFDQRPISPSAQAVRWSLFNRRSATPSIEHRLPSIKNRNGRLPGGAPQTLQHRPCLYHGTNVAGRVSNL